MSCGCLDVVRRRAVSEMCCTSSPSLAVRNSASPKGWSQKWAHDLWKAANHSEISTSKALRGLPWAQGVAGSNPAAPTTFQVPGFQRGSTPSALSGVTRRSSTSPPVHRHSNQARPVGTLLAKRAHFSPASLTPLNQFQTCLQKRDVDWVRTPEAESTHGPEPGACRSDIVAADEDRSLPFALSRSRRRVPAAIREPQDRQVWVRARMCQRVDPRGVREATHQMR